MNKNICIFSHYYHGNSIPLYVRMYLIELKHYFDEIILVTNERIIDNLGEIENLNISIKLVKNEGYDFGMFYKAYQTIEINNYDQIACINDSNVVFGNLRFLFNWGSKQKVDFWGLVDSHQKPSYSRHKNNYHLQSHFIVFNKTAIQYLPEFFERINFNEFIKEPNISTLKKKVVNDWEIGLTQFLFAKNLSCKSYINSAEYYKEYNKTKPVNIPTKLYAETIANGVPVLKKRVVTSTHLRHVCTIKGNWKRLIWKYGAPEWEIEKLIAELTVIRKDIIKQKTF